MNQADSEKINMIFLGILDISKKSLFLAVLAACLLIFDLYVFYLYFYGFDFPQDEKKAVLFAKSDHERALKIIDERDKLFSDIAAENKTIFPNPFR